jgi:hypothetical protein
MISTNLGEEKIMGGFGSGRGQRGKDTTSDMRPLDIRKLQRDGLLTPGRAFGWHWTCQRQRGGINSDTNGSRPRDSQLPKPKQRRRVATDGIPVAAGMDGPAILAGGGRGSFARRKDAGGAWRFSLAVPIFACRHCHKLAYACQRETDDDRAMRRADTIRRRLGWKAGIANPKGGKPKGMHWRTFERLTAEHDALRECVAGRVWRERLGLVTKRLDAVKRLAEHWGNLSLLNLFRKFGCLREPR